MMNIGKKQVSRGVSGKGPPPWVPFGKNLAAALREYEQGKGFKSLESAKEENKVRDC